MHVWSMHACHRGKKSMHTPGRKIHACIYTCMLAASKPNNTMRQSSYANHMLLRIVASEFELNKRGGMATNFPIARALWLFFSQLLLLFLASLILSMRVIKRERHNVNRGQNSLPAGNAGENSNLLCRGATYGWVVRSVSVGLGLGHERERDGLGLDFVHFRWRDPCGVDGLVERSACILFMCYDWPEMMWCGSRRHGS
jgi:hypothetical protein